MVFRLVGLAGMIVLPLLVRAAPEVGIQHALDRWARTGGISTVAYQGPEEEAPPKSWPRWLLHPPGRRGLAAQLIARGVYPEATSLTWWRGGPAYIFGDPYSEGGFQLVVARETGVPLQLRTVRDERWEFQDYTRKALDRGRRLIPQQIVHWDAKGHKTVFRAR